MKDRLIELIEEAYYCSIEEIADHLIAGGVTLDNQVSSSTWVPVKYSLPEEYEPVLVYNPDVGHGQTVMRAVRIGACWKTEFDFEAEENSEITHWMPMPEPPGGVRSE